MKRTVLCLVCLFMLMSCTYTSVSPETSYCHTTFSIRNQSGTDLAFHWDGMEEELDRYEYILFNKQSVTVMTMKSEEGYATLQDLREKTGDVTLFCPSDSKEGVWINIMFYDKSNWTVTESDGRQLWELCFSREDIVAYQ